MEFPHLAKRANTQLKPGEGETQQGVERANLSTVDQCGRRQSSEIYLAGFGVYQQNFLPHTMSFFLRKQKDSRALYEV